jgi:hypothetical protein
MQVWIILFDRSKMVCVIRRYNGKILGFEGRFFRYYVKKKMVSATSAL